MLAINSGYNEITRIMSTTSQPVSTPARGLIAESLRVIVPLLILAAGFGFLMISGKLREIPQKPPAEVGLPRVQTASVSAYDEGMMIDVDGLVVPFREILLTSEVEGTVKKKNFLCRAGRFVKAGTPLIELDPADYQLELRRLQQELRQAEVSHQEVDVQIENLKELVELVRKEQGLQSREVQRLESLAVGRVVSKSDLDRAQTTEVVSRNALQRVTNEARVLVTRRAAAEVSIELAETKVAQAELNLARTKITAPVDGVIVRDLVEEGAYMQRGAALVEFEDTSAVEVQCNLMIDEVAWLTEGQTATDAYSLPNAPVRVIAQRGGKRYVWDGVLSRFDGMGLDEKTRMFPCRVLVQDPTAGRRLTTASVIDQQQQESPQTLMRGMYVRVEIAVPTDKSLAEIPRKALRLGNVVWRIRDGKLSIVPVNLAQRLADAVLIELPRDLRLAVDDRVVVSPMTGVTEGMEVEEIINDQVARRELTVGDALAEPSQPEGEFEESAATSSEETRLIEEAAPSATRPATAASDLGVST